MILMTSLRTKTTMNLMKAKPKNRKRKAKARKLILILIWTKIMGKAVSHQPLTQTLWMTTNLVS